MENKEDNKNLLKGYNMLLYFAGTMIMYEPSEECVIDFWKNGILKELPVKSMNKRFIKAASQLRESCEDNTLCTDFLRNDYNRLFISGSEHRIRLFESQYNDDVTTHTYPKRESVTEFYDSYGWSSKFRGKISDDHLGIEILFLTRLVEKYLILDDEACSNEMSNEIRRFIDQHLLTWIHKWDTEIQGNALTLCYKGIGTLIYACVEDIRSLISDSGSKISQS